MNEPEIAVELTRVERGQLKGLANVSIPSALGEITLRGFRVIEKDGQAPWVGFPTSGYVKNGKPQNYPLLELPASLRRKVVDAVLAEYDRARKRAGSF